MIGSNHITTLFFRDWGDELVPMRITCRLDVLRAIANLPGLGEEKGGAILIKELEFCLSNGEDPPVVPISTWSTISTFAHLITKLITRSGCD